MKEGRVQDFFDWLAGRLFEGELNWLEDVFVYPMTTFIGRQIRIESTPNDTRLYLESRRGDAAKLGAYGVSANVIQVTQRPNSGRFSAHVEYLFHGSDGSELTRNKVLYRCHLTSDDRIMIESLELFEYGLPFNSPLPKTRQH